MADLTITAANVVKGSGASVGNGTAGATIKAGEPIYKDSTDSNKLKLADADALATAAVDGIALHGADSGQPIQYCTKGLLTMGATVAIGTTYVLSDTAGGISPSGDHNVTGDYTTVIGVGTTTGIIDVNIQISGVALP